MFRTGQSGEQVGAAEQTGSSMAAGGRGVSGSGSGISSLLLPATRSVVGWRVSSRRGAARRGVAWCVWKKAVC